MTMSLPQLDGSPLVTDGGMETDLIFHHGIDLPEFAAFPLITEARGREILRRYYGAYAEIARRVDCGLSLEAPTWRASADWGARIGFDRAGLTQINIAAIDFLHELAHEYAGFLPSVVVTGMVGPRGDGYRSTTIEVEEAAAYHHDQVAAFADAGADIVTAYTLTTMTEALGIILDARAFGVPVAIGFTVETDGRLPSGMSVQEAITGIDSIGGPNYFLLNCAHPTHMARALTETGNWRERILGVRANASQQSHAELDEATDLDDGDPAELADSMAVMHRLLPNLRIIGGCCGTDARHVSHLWEMRMS